MQCSAATYGSCIKVNGTLMASEHDGQPVEVKAESIEVVGSCHLKVNFYFVICFYLHVVMHVIIPINMYFLNITA